MIKEEITLLNNDPLKVFIGGFSQGCCMAINTALSYEHTLGGVVGLSGHAFPSMIEMIEQDTEGTFDGKKKDLRIFAYHGKADGVINEGKAGKTYEKLIAAGFTQLKYRTEEWLEHSVSPTEIEAIQEFLRSVMTSA